MTTNAQLSGLHEAPERLGFSMQTFTGRLYWPIDPRPEEVCIEDIAHHLSNICRFGGATTCHYSVAQHSYLVSLACLPEHALLGQLHDAAEAYCGDAIGPIKKYPPFAAIYDEIEAKNHVAIMAHFGLPAEIPDDVKHADRVLRSTEQRDLMGGARVEVVSGYAPLGDRIVAWSPELSEQMFLLRFAYLTTGRAVR
jgi:hypothetical protein